MASLTVSANQRTFDLYVASFIVVTIGACTTILPVGFRGADDYQYLLAAQRWLSEGPNIGENHWANRVPYVWTWVAALSLPSAGEWALRLVHGVLFAIMVFAGYLIGLASFRDRWAAACGTALALFTPLLLRMPTFFYPEALEMSALAICALLVLRAGDYHGGTRTRRLVIAGLIGGIAVLVRQTAVAIPAALAFAMLISEDGRSWPSRLRDVVFLAIGFLIPLAIETGLYLAVTGDALHRFTIDASHAKISSEIMKGGAYARFDNALFNWDLARSWEGEDIAPVHWAIVPLFRLLFSPGLLLTPILAIVGGVIAWRMGGRARRFAILVTAAITVQYVLNTFVLVTAPRTRYFGVSLLFLCLLAGLAIATLKPRILGVAVLTAAVAIPGVIATIMQPHPIALAANLRRAAFLHTGMLHINAPTARILALRIVEEPELRARFALGAPPVGGLAVTIPNARNPGFAGLCRDGAPADVILSEIGRASLATAVANVPGAAWLPEAVLARFDRRDEVVTIHRRRC